MPAASAAHRASLQQRRALTRRRSARQLVSPAIGLKQFEILLISLPTDVAWVSVWDAGEPVAGVVLSLDLFPAVGCSPIPAASVHIDACVSRLLKTRIAVHAVSGWKTVTRPPVRRDGKLRPSLRNTLTVLARRADARERLEEVTCRPARRSPASDASPRCSSPGARPPAP